jgi:cell division protein FtsI (penicillin-binding protein 3)
MDNGNGNESRSTRRRTLVLAVVLGLWTLGIFARLIQLQAFGHAESSVKVAHQNQLERDIPTDRGMIRDRTGKTLARSIPSYSISYEPSPDSSPEAQMAPIRAAAPILGLDARDLEQKRRQLEKGKSRLYLKREADAETARKVAERKIPGLHLNEEPHRYYPNGSLAAHVLGGVDVDEKGLAGIELRYNGVLGGRAGSRLVLRDALRREYNVETLFEPKPGKDIDLTLDLQIQYFAQSALVKACSEHQAAWGSVIVGSPATGEILAMASFPDYDPNALSSASPEQMTDRAVRHMFDPGSTFKIVTAAAAIEHSRVDLADTFDCATGAISVAGGPIRDHKAFGRLAFSDVIAHSSNIGTIQVARRVGPDLFYGMVRAFGFGGRTGIDLPAEAAGLVHPPNAWSRRSLDAMSVGYEISVTTLQLLQAISAIADRGEIVPPRLLKSVAGRGPENASPSGRRRIMSAAAAETLVGVLIRAVREGTGTAALIPGLTVAGKTGTAQLLERDSRGYTSSRHLAAFAGFVPAEKPALAIVVVICDPKSRQDVYYGGQVAAPVFREIASKSLRYLKIDLAIRPLNVVAGQASGGQEP